MTASTYCRFAIAFVSALIFAANSRAQEKSIARSDLPPAVEKTVGEQSHGATIQGFSTEVENGRRLFEAEMTVDGHGKDISIDAQGRIVEIEEQVTMDSLSAAVKAGLIKAAGSGTITKIETLTKQGKLVAYEVSVRNGSKRSEVQVGPDGKKLTNHE